MHGSKNRRRLASALLGVGLCCALPAIGEEHAALTPIDWVRITSMVQLDKTVIPQEKVGWIAEQAAERLAEAGIQVGPPAAASVSSVGATLHLSALFSTKKIACGSDSLELLAATWGARLDCTYESQAGDLTLIPATAWTSMKIGLVTREQIQAVINDGIDAAVTAFIQDCRDSRSAAPPRRSPLPRPASPPQSWDSPSPSSGGYAPREPMTMPSREASCRLCGGTGIRTCGGCQGTGFNPAAPAGTLCSLCRGSGHLRCTHP
jgi:hypothetical protein